MKKLLILTIFCATCSTVLAQIEKRSSLSIGGGYALNVALNPESLDDDGELLGREDLWDNGTFQAINFRNTFKHKKGNHFLKLKLNVGNAWYQTENDADRHHYDIAFTYRTKYASRKYFEFSPELNRRRRDGVNLSDAVLQMPFSYTLINLPLRFDFYMRNKVWLKTSVGYLSKDFDRAAGQLIYRAPYAGALVSKKWKNTERTTKLSASTETQFRFYQDIRAIAIDDDDEEEPLEEEEFDERSRQWTYMRNNLTYQLNFERNKLALEAGLFQILRLDRDGRNGFNELGAGVKASIPVDKWRLSGYMRYSMRNYSNLAPGADNNTLLEYRYIRTGFNVGYRLKKWFDIYLGGSLVDRTSNNPTITSAAFREYTNGQVEAGVTVRF